MLQQLKYFFFFVTLPNCSVHSFPPWILLCGAVCHHTVTFLYNFKCNTVWFLYLEMINFQTVCTTHWFVMGGMAALVIEAIHRVLLVAHHVTRSCLLLTGL